MSGGKGWGCGRGSCKLRCWVPKSTKGHDIHTHNNTQLDPLRAHFQIANSNVWPENLKNMSVVLCFTSCPGASLSPGHSRVGVSSTKTQPEGNLHQLGMCHEYSTVITQKCQPSMSECTHATRHVQPENLEYLSATLYQQFPPSAAMPYARFRSSTTITLQVTYDDPNAGTSELECFGVY